MHKVVVVPNSKMEVEKVETPSTTEPPAVERQRVLEKQKIDDRIRMAPTVVRQQRVAAEVWKVDGGQACRMDLSLVHLLLLILFPCDIFRRAGRENVSLETRVVSSALAHRILRLGEGIDARERAN